MEQLPSDRYRSIQSPAKGQYKDLGSKFLAFAYPVENEVQVKEIVAGLKKEYFDAKHHCFAYRLGCDGAKWRVNDDGEPSSSAGRPILGQLLSNELSDILVVVVRYFGGTKLGIPGLIKAYKSSTADAIANASIIEKTACEFWKVSFGYEAMNDVMKAIKELKLEISSQSMDSQCSLILRVPLSQITTIQEKLSFFILEKVDF